MGKVLGTTVAEALAAAGVRRRDHVVVAVSGGVDSMVLLHVLVRLAPRLGLGVHVAHVHHGLRGRSADRDAALVSSQAVGDGLPVSVERLSAGSRPRGVSLQAWARAARYARLEAVRRRVGAAWILTAHNRNDQAETVLLNLLRGTGPRGMAGIPATRGRILRPLLGVPRSQIERYAGQWGVRYREDPSNRSIVYRRNRIRQELMPMLAREYNPRIVETLASLATQVREDDDALTAQAAALAGTAIRVRRGTARIDVLMLRAAPHAVARRLLQEMFRRVAGPEHGLTRRHLAALAALAARGGTVRLPGGLRAWVSGTHLRIGKGAPPTGRPQGVGPPTEREMRPGVTLRPGRWVRWAPGRCAVRIRQVTGDTRAREGDPCREILSATILEKPLHIRAWRAGDRFGPLGLRGHKKLQDFFVDAKIPRGERRRVPLLVAGDRIAWVVGHRIAEEFRWTGQRTACLAEARFTEKSGGLSARSGAAVRR